MANIARADGSLSEPAARRPEIDGLRALAVLAVLVCHTLSFGDATLWANVGRAGSRGVELFFVLSGFCLAFPYLNAQPGQSRPLPVVATFLRRRFARIAPPYYVAIALFSVLAFTKFGLPTWPPNAPTINDIVSDAWLAAAFFPNPQLNCDFWSLGVEMRWYVLFPIVFALYARSKIAFVAVAIVSYALYKSPVGVLDFGILPAFMSGIVAADIAVRNVWWHGRVWPLALVIVGAAAWQQSRNADLDHGDLLWHLAAFSTVVAVTGNTRIARMFSHPVLVATGVASYSIYLLHHPILAELAIRGVPLFAAASAALISGFLFWRYIEAPLVSAGARSRIERALTIPRFEAMWKARAADRS